MSALKSTLRLEGYFIKPFFKSILILLVFPLAFAFGNQSVSVGITVTMGIAMLFASYNFVQEEKGNVAQIFGVLPIDEKTRVKGRYLFVVLAGLITLVFAVILSSLVGVWGGFFAAEEVVLGSLLGMLVFSLFVSIQLPMFYKYGYSKARFFTFIPYILVVVLAPTATMIAKDMDTQALNNWMQTLMQNPALFAVLGAAAALVISLLLFFISYRLSVGILKRKMKN